MRKVINKNTNLKANSKVFFAILFILAVALLIVHMRVLTDNLKYENSNKEGEEKELLKDSEHLKEELESLKSPLSIEKKAFHDGMIYPKDWQIKTIEF